MKSISSFSSIDKENIFKFEILLQVKHFSILWTVVILKIKNFEKTLHVYPTYLWNSLSSLTVHILCTCTFFPGYERLNGIIGVRRRDKWSST